MEIVSQEENNKDKPLKNNKIKLIVSLVLLFVLIMYIRSVKYNKITQNFKKLQELYDKSIETSKRENKEYDHNLNDYYDINVSVSNNDITIDNNKPIGFTDDYIIKNNEYLNLLCKTAKLYSLTVTSKNFISMKNIYHTTRRSNHHNNWKKNTSIIYELMNNHKNIIKNLTHYKICK
jgi:hypothetical protein